MKRREQNPLSKWLPMWYYFWERAITLFQDKSLDYDMEIDVSRVIAWVILVPALYFRRYNVMTRGARKKSTLAAGKLLCTSLQIVSFSLGFVTVETDIEMFLSSTLVIQFEKAGDTTGYAYLLASIRDWRNELWMISPVLQLNKGYKHRHSRVCCFGVIVWT